MPSDRTALELLIPPAVVTLLIGGAQWAVSSWLPVLDMAVVLRWFIAEMLATVGGLFGLAGIFAFRKARTTIHPVRPADTTTLVTTGVYRVSRNPMYVGLLFVLAGWAVFLANAAAFVLLPVFVVYMNRYQIAPEERFLEQQFGDAFSVYRNTVRRWL